MGLISHKFEGTGEGGCWHVHWRAAQELRESSRCSWVWAGRAAGGCPVGQAGSWAGAQWVWDGRAAGGCLMGQAGSWAGAQWACSWRLPDEPGWQLGGCTMGVQLAVARWARLAAGRVHYGCAAGGCPMGQAGSWGYTMGMQLCIYGHAAGGCPMGQAVSWACYGYPGALPRMPDTHDMQARSISHTKIVIKASDVAQIIYIYIQISYKHSVVYAHIH